MMSDSERERKLSPEERRELERAEAVILRLKGAPPPSDPSTGPPVLRRYRVLLNGVTWVESTKAHLDNTTKATVRDKKGQNREVVIDRAIVEAYNEADAWLKFCQSWGITSSAH